MQKVAMKIKRAADSGSVFLSNGGKTALMCTKSQDWNNSTTEWAQR